MPSGLTPEQRPADTATIAPLHIEPGRPPHFQSLNLRSHYHPASDWDEAVDPEGHPRSYWSNFYDSLDELGDPELRRRWRDAQRLIRDNGVTYNVYGDARGTSRPWQLDSIPLLISPGEAAHLEAGLSQRIRLLELLLSDFYGPQRLLREGLVPAELLYTNPGFLRPLHGVPLPENRYLHLYATNLGRGKDGHWRVLGDRTQAPSGAGYALENRIVMTRTLPEAFRDCRVQRIALFFQSFRNTLRSISPRNKENPRVVLLTPGPYNETYFEHAYLARYLGYTLVEGGDLTVRDNRVFLKVLGGLQPVDVIFRRMDDDFCDPLELRPDSFLGVPGLTHAVRSNNVAVANALGSGVIENPALLAYLPRLCRALLGEDLRLESVPSWWCGDPGSRRYVLDHLNEMAIKHSFSASRMEPQFPLEMSQEQRDMLIQKIRHRPQDYIAQSRLDLSTCPVWNDGQLVARKLVLRTYMTWDGTDAVMMPGGLTRVSASDHATVVSMQRGGGSKDTWVLAAGPVSEFSLLGSSSRVELTRAGGDLPSRAADNLFWLGRYAERAEGLTRLLRGIAVRLAERSGLTDAPELPALFRALSSHSEPTARAVEPDDLNQWLIGAVFDQQFAMSLGSVLHSFRRVASIVRDRISMDMWRVVNGFSQFPTDPYLAYGEDGPTAADVLDLLNEKIITLAAFDGLAVECMTRGEGWRFLDMGRRIERALHMIALLKGTIVHTTPNEAAVLDAVLEVADSSMTYRRRYLSSLRAEGVLDLLICDETNPRALATQLAHLDEDVNHLPRPAGLAGRSPEQRMTLSALSAVRLAEVEKLASTTEGVRVTLASLLEELLQVVPEISDTITLQYLSHLQTSRHMATQENPRRTANDSGDQL